MSPCAPLRNALRLACCCCSKVGTVEDELDDYHLSAPVVTRGLLTSGTAKCARDGLHPNVENLSRVGIDRRFFMEQQMRDRQLDAFYSEQHDADEMRVTPPDACLLPLTSPQLGSLKLLMV